MRRGGFTLIECLVVMAVLALLTGFLLPTLVAAKERGRDIVCQVNLKQNAADTLIFVQNTGLYPFGFCSSGGFSSVPPGGYVGDGAKDWFGWWWFHQITEDKSPRENASLRCPSQIQTTNLLCGNYGANYSIYKIGDMSGDEEFFGDPLKAARLARPGRTLLLMDSGYTLISWKATLPSASPAFENPQRIGSFYLPGLASNAQQIVEPDQQHDAVRGRHSGRSVNAAFADGHLESLSASRLAVSGPDDASRYRWRP